jgi:hypothetical protein
MTLAHEIKAPWKKHYSHSAETYRPTLVTVWHVDPETDGTDDSCDYSGTRPRLTPAERDLFNRLQRFDTVIGNDPFYSEHATEVRELYEAMWTWRSERRSRFHWSPAWHVHHWRITIEPWARLRRRFDRCAVCGQRMGTATRMGNWYGDKVWHMGCDSLPTQPI